jgi:hypothetical protein
VPAPSPLKPQSPNAWFIAGSIDSPFTLHRQKTFKISTDLFFEEKVREIVALYLTPPEKAVVLLVDEKTHVQALAPT